MTRQQKQSVDNRANQLNPTHPAYHQSRGSSAEEAEQLATQERGGSTPAPEGETATPAPGKPSQK